MRTEHAAKKWVDGIDPIGALDPYVRSLLIHAYGAGLDAGLAEAQEIIDRLKEDLTQARPW